MSEEEQQLEKELAEPWTQHRFMILVGAAILISMFLVGIALALYASSGAAQLDLSRPGYVSVRDQAATDNGQFDGFSATGSIDKTTLSEFRHLYDVQAKKATSVDSFSGDVMSDAALSIDAPPVDEAVN